MKELILKYENCIKECTVIKNDLADNKSSTHFYEILIKTYRTFISELQSILDKENIKTDY